VYLPIPPMTLFTAKDIHAWTVIALTLRQIPCVKFPKIDVFPRKHRFAITMLRVMQLDQFHKPKQRAIDLIQCRNRRKDTSLSSAPEAADSYFGVIIAANGI